MGASAPTIKGIEMKHLTEKEQDVMQEALLKSVDIIDEEKWTAIGIFYNRWYEAEDGGQEIKKLFFQSDSDKEEFIKELLSFCVKQMLSDTVWIPTFYFVGKVNTFYNLTSYSNKFGDGYYEAKTPWANIEWNAEIEEQRKEDTKRHAEEKIKQELYIIVLIQTSNIHICF